MRQINEVIITGIIQKIYPLVLTPVGVKVSRFVLEHSSEQIENNQQRKVHCKIFCVKVGSELGCDLLNSQVSVSGFLSTNMQKQLVLHINKIDKIGLKEF